MVNQRISTTRRRAVGAIGRRHVDSSMDVLQYTLAVLAIAAAVLLGSVR